MGGASAETPTSSTGRRLTLAALALAAVSPVALPFTEWAWSNPWLALPLVAVWEVTLLATAFALDVWAEVRPTLVGRAADRLNFWIDCLLSEHRKRYLQDVIYQHRNFDVKGLSTQATFTLELEQVFVDLSLAPIAPHQASADMIRKLPPGLREGRHQLWDFLQGAGGATAKLVLLGAPGSGKTTLLKHVALTFAHGRSPTRTLMASRNLPILLFLREHADAICERPDVTLSERIATHLQRERSLKVPAAWFDTQLVKNRCLIMFDGLDEVADPEVRSKVSTWVDRQMSIHGGNRFIITSRPHGYRDNPLNGVTVLDVRPLTHDQVRDFVHRWYIANEIKAQQRDDSGVRQDAKSGARDLLDRLHGAPALSDLAVNPLLLTMIATVHRYRSSLPGRRVELYAEICEVSLGRRQQSKGIQLDLTPAQKQRVLEPLAWTMMIEKKREIILSDACKTIQTTLERVNRRIAPRDFLVKIENDSSLLIEKEATGVYAFAHLTFQEFLAACHSQQNNDRISVLVNNISDGWWTECIRLFAATGDATQILNACIEKHPSDLESLALALQCLTESESKDPAVERKIDLIIERDLNDIEPGKRRPVVEALIRIRIGHMRSLNDNIYIDSEFMSCSEYQLFLDEQRAMGKNRSPIHWKGEVFPPGQGRTPILGLSFDEGVSFCKWLSERHGGQHRFRIPTTQELAEAEFERRAEGGAYPWAQVSMAEPAPAPWPEFFEARHRAIASEPDGPKCNDLTLIRRIAHTRALAVDIDPELRLAVALALALARSIGLKSALACDFPPDYADLERALALRLTLSLHPDTDRALARNPSALDLARFLASNPDRAPALALDIASALAQALDFARSDAGWRLIAGLAAVTQSGPADDSAATLVRASDCGVALLNLWVLCDESKGAHANLLSRVWREIHGGTDFVSKLIDLTVQVVRDLRMAAKLRRARIEGSDPPFEALLVVKERLDGESTSPP